MNDRSNVVSFAAKRKKSLNARAALPYLAKIAEGHPDGVVEVDTITQLGTLLGWDQPKISKNLKAWRKTGKVTVEKADNGKLRIRVMPSLDDLLRSSTPSRRTRVPRGKRATKRAAEHATDHAKPANTDDRSTSHDNQSNSTGTQNMRETSSENVPANVAQRTPRGAVNGTPPTTVPGTPSRQPSRHGNRDVAHHAEDLNWHAVGGGRAGEDDALHSRRNAYLIAVAYLTAITLAVIAAWFSVRGMVVLYPGDPEWARILGIGLEAGKIVTAALLAAFWGILARWLRWLLLVLVIGCEILNASGVFGQLVIAHLQKGAVAEANFVRSEAETSGRIDVAQGRVADLDRQIATIDSLIAGAAQNGKPMQAARVKREQEPKRAQLIKERDQARKELASARAGRANSSAQHKVDEAEAAPVVWAARSLGFAGDSEVIISKMIALTVLCLDPLAVLLLAAVHTLNSRRQRRAA